IPGAGRTLPPALPKPIAPLTQRRGPAPLPPPPGDFSHPVETPSVVREATNSVPIILEEEPLEPAMAEGVAESSERPPARPWNRRSGNRRHGQGILDRCRDGMGRVVQGAKRGVD